MQKIITILKVQCVELSEEKLDKKHPVYTASKQTSKIKIVNGEDFDVYAVVGKVTVTPLQSYITSYFLE